MTEEKPIVATLVLKAGGMARQRIQLSGKRNLDFIYRRGLGHVREYTDIQTFHQEETALREIVRLPLNIRTILGTIDARAKAEGVLAELIADRGGHRPTKHARLCELRALLDAEIARLEKTGVGQGAEKPRVEPPPPPSARDMAIERRRSFLRRAGEEHTRNIARDYGLQVPKLNNYQGLMDAIVEREFPAAEREAAEASTDTPLKPAGPVAADSEGEPDLERMPMAELRKLAKGRGVKGANRKEMVEALKVAR
jgi:hypothetical protein